MKQSGFLYELRPTDYILGSTSPLKGEELNSTGDWRAWAPLGEKQYSAKFDTMSCTTFSATSKLEVLFNFFLENNKFTGLQVQWLKDNGYIENGKFNFSDRFCATVNGTMPNGQYFQNVWDSFRKDGLIPEKDHPFGGNNQAEYLDKTKITQKMRDKAKEFLDTIIEKDETGYRINYEWVPITETGIELAESFKQAPIQVAVTKDQPQHAILLVKMDWEWESYPPFLRERNRTVAYALKAIVKIKPETIVPDPTPKPIETKYKYFTDKEIVGLKPELVKILDDAREIAGVPFVISSGFRTPEENKKAGGVANSSHLSGKAVDLRCALKDHQKRSRILWGLMQFRDKLFIEICGGHIHVDIDSTIHPLNSVMWGNDES